MIQRMTSWVTEIEDLPTPFDSNELTSIDKNDEIIVVTSSNDLATNTVISQPMECSTPMVTTVTLPIPTSIPNPSIATTTQFFPNPVATTHRFFI